MLRLTLMTGPTMSEEQQQRARFACPVPGCPDHIGANIFCNRHWKMVPHQTREAIREASRRGQKDEYLERRQRAIDIALKVQAAEEKQPKLF